MLRRLANSVVVADFPMLLAQLATTTGLFVIGLATYILADALSRAQAGARRQHRRGDHPRRADAGAGDALLGAMLAHSVSLPDIALWGVVTLILQLIAFAAVALVVRNLPAAIERGEIAPALVLATAQIAAGIFNAAAMSG